MILHADSSTRYCADSWAGDEGRLTHREHDSNRRTASAKSGKRFSEKIMLFKRELGQKGVSMILI
ncbi:hypothetical protein X773_25425 [Mesorhizobium sp. LSJC285A00]|nr:hypothetical protein X773_25425 [Mesorhizobium sp. LSJC285A00]